jgi:hypothetical protein
MRSVWNLRIVSTQFFDKTTGWIHRTSLKNRAVEMFSGVT